METEICGAILDFGDRVAFLEADALVAVLAEPTIVPFPSVTGSMECTLFEGVALPVVRVGAGRTAIVLAPSGAEARSRVVVYGVAVRAVTRGLATGDGSVRVGTEVFAKIVLSDLVPAGI